MRASANPITSKGRVRHIWAPIALLGLVLLLCVGGLSQQGGAVQNSGVPRSVFLQQAPSPFGPFDQQPISPEAQRRMNMINNARQKSLVADSDKLLALATELSREIAKSNSGELSPEQIRKVAAIEKLAHNVRDKMVMPVHNPALNMDSSPFSPIVQ